MRRYQLLEAGGNHRNANLNDDDDDFNFEDHPPLQICSSRSKNIIIFGILITLGLFIYIPFLPFSSNRPIAFVWPANQSRDVSLLVRPQEVTTKIWPTSACPQNESKSEDLFLLVIVFSAIKNFNERQTIRDTWASDEIPNSQVIFLLGHLGGNDSIPLQINVTKESETFGDILQEDFIDSYANLSLKTLMMLKWYEQSCSHVPYILKTDDDVYLNMNNLHKLVKMNKIPNLLMGTLICGAVPIRDPYNKWYSPHYMYDKKRYPNYLSGTGYVMSKSTALTLYEASIETPIFHMEDIYVTGILAQKSGIRPQDNVGFSYLKRRATTCLYAQTISSHHLTIREMHQMHEKVKAKQGKCAPIKKKYLRTYGPGRCLWTKPK